MLIGRGGGPSTIVSHNQGVAYKRNISYLKNIAAYDG